MTTLLTINDVAKFLSVSRRSVHRFVEVDKLRAVYIQGPLSRKEEP